MCTDPILGGGWKLVGGARLVVRVVLWLACPCFAQSTHPCGSLSSSYGPFDFRNQKHQLEIVEKHHFQPQVEMLIRGQEGYIGGDLDYVLRTSPNHHRALAAMIRFGERLKTEQVPHATYSIECYLERAVRFRGDDVIARMLYAMHLAKLGRRADALGQMDIVVEQSQDSGLTMHNAGLVLMDLQAYDKALLAAHRAIALGMNRPDLRQRLEHVGKWADPGSPSAPGGANERPTPKP